MKIKLLNSLKMTKLFLTKIFNLDNLIFLLILSGFVFPALLFRFNINIDTNQSSKIDPSAASNIGSWLAGTTGLLWGLASIIFIYKTFRLSRIQQDETNFFNLMNQLHTIVGNIKGSFLNDNNEHCGTAFFSKFLTVYKAHVSNDWIDYQIEYANNKNLENPFKVTEEESTSLLIAFANTKLPLPYKLWCYKNLYDMHQSELGHFYRLVYNIIKHIHTSENMSKNQKEKLVRILAAQLTNDQLGMIFYNILLGYGKFKKFVEEDYPDFFQNIDPNSLIDFSDIEYYPNAQIVE